jgi:hypothetical protein
MDNTVLESLGRIVPQNFHWQHCLQQLQENDPGHSANLKAFIGWRGNYDAHGSCTIPRTGLEATPNTAAGNYTHCSCHNLCLAGWIMSKSNLNEGVGRHSIVLLVTRAGAAFISLL